MCALALMWVGAGCSKKDEEPAAGKVSPTEVAKDSEASKTIKPNSAALPLPLVDAEIDDRSELRFLGFGNKDRIYAYESMYGFRAESAGDPACFVRFRDVILAESGELIARFRMERREDDPTQFDRLWDEQWKLARPESEWAAFAAQWEIQPSEPSSEEGEWRLNVTPPDKIPPLTDLQVSKEGIAFLLSKQREAGYHRAEHRIVAFRPMHPRFCSVDVAWLVRRIDESILWHYGVTYTLTATDEGWKIATTAPNKELVTN